MRRQAVGRLHHTVLNDRTLQGREDAAAAAALACTCSSSAGLQHHLPALITTR